MDPKTDDIRKEAPVPRPEDLPLIRGPPLPVPGNNGDDDNDNDWYYPDLDFGAPQVNDTGDTTEQLPKSATTLPAAPVVESRTTAIGTTMNSTIERMDASPHTVQPPVEPLKPRRSDDEVSLGAEDSTAEAMGPQIAVDTPVMDAVMDEREAVIEDPLEFATSCLMIYGVPLAEGFESMQTRVSSIATQLHLFLPPALPLQPVNYIAVLEIEGLLILQSASATTVPSAPAALNLPHGALLPFGANIAFMWSPSGNTLSPVLLQGNGTVLPYQMPLSGPTPIPSIPLSSRLLDLHDLSSRLSDTPRVSLADRLEVAGSMDMELPSFFVPMTVDDPHLAAVSDMMANAGPLVLDPVQYDNPWRPGDPVDEEEVEDKSMEEVTWKKTKQGRRSGQKIQDI
ncbi:uncharacterized protein LACBIDRAFT_326071 [Laccaria bicolor S238N-H82]|uniref:Predicted protein n=1 Tax=Laccaria bicolor (strain S238N-H82 / ATCC MYA-4686) TaxID=486041 RepID=B0D773_LACBS|nr:uncharacterized protein LACBIDRAFT_326071 [Laccaria bicolor S238N-H82]EDR09348.1 predicted protein [Laccaria bicolor S238N-H82]|eukprot:XP_001879697.1 predicted protein [Laccaria bicolor S238N-H82]